MTIESEAVKRVVAAIITAPDGRNYYVRNYSRVVAEAEAAISAVLKEIATVTPEMLDAQLSQHINGSSQPFASAVQHDWTAMLEASPLGEYMPKEGTGGDG